MLYSASYNHAMRLGRAPHYFLRRQTTFVVLGAIGALLASWTPLALIRRSLPLLLLASFSLLLMTFLPAVGEPILGARRWIFIGGMSFQPSELAKVVLVIYLAGILSKKEDRLDDAVNSIVPPLIIVSVFVGIILLQNDFSTALFVFFICLAIFYIARVRLIYFALLGTLIAPLGAILLFTREHRVERLISFLEPDRDPAGSGFQIIQARQALMNGGLWGRGLGMGTKKLGSLPEAHSDFIFAVVGEELGLIGMMAVLLLFVMLAIRGYTIAARAGDSFGYYLAFGATTMIVAQAVLNIAVVAGLVPATGIPLPFFSGGGSSIVASMTLIGLLVNVSRGQSRPGEVLHV
jgi:cell division protein FtsW